MFEEPLLQLQVNFLSTDLFTFLEIESSLARANRNRRLIQAEDSGAQRKELFRSGYDYNTSAIGQECKREAELEFPG